MVCFIFLPALSKAQVKNEGEDEYVNGVDIPALLLQYYNRKRPPINWEDTTKGVQVAAELTPFYI